MKKFIYIGIIVQTILCLYIFFSLYNKFELNNLLYKDKEQMTLLIEDYSKVKSPDDQQDYIYKYAKKYNVKINKYIFSSDKNLKIYANDISLDNNIKIFNHHRNLNKIKSKKDFIWTDKDITVEIKDFSYIPETGISGIYYIESNNSANKTNFINNVKKLGTVKLTTDFPSKINNRKLLFDNYNVLMVWLILLIINISILLQHLINSNKKISILKVNGWTNNDIVINFLSPIIKTILMTITISVLAILSYFLVHFGGFPYIYHFLIFTGFELISLLLIYSIIITIYILTSTKYRNTIIDIKGKKISNIGVIFNVLCKCILAIFIILLSANIITAKQNLIKTQSENQYFNKARNIYATELRFITNDQTEYKPFAENLKKFFNKASLDNQLFMIDSSNYEKFNNGKRMYEMNTQSSTEQLISPSGQSIVTNINYFKYNPIKKINGKDIITKKDLVFNDKTLNILVPDKLKKYENIITSEYKKYYGFLKNLSTETKDKNTVINIVYVKNNQRYFTYNPNIEIKDFTIKDPITIIDTGQFDSSFYASWLSHCSFVESVNEDGYNYLLPTIVATKTQPSIQNTISIYNFKAEEINRQKNAIFIYTVLTICLIVIQIVNIYFSYQLLLRKYMYELYIKKIFGFSCLELLLPIMLPITVIDIVLVSLLILIIGSHHIFLVALSWLIFEFIISCASVWYLKKIILNNCLEKIGDEL
ncbi:ABC transporter permease [Enterococcus faecium]|uniref:ABC transporter permease n=1 Tax=Enterococcus faecium TaxID=1352 RepID=UPI003516E750